MTFADNISANLCEAISAEPCFEPGKVWGLAELVERNGAQFPVSSTRGEGNDIMPDARFPVQVYFRVISSDREEDSEGYGVQEFRHRMTMRIVAIGDVRTLSGCFNANHAIADLIERAIDLNYTFPDWYNVLTGRIRKNTDKREVLQSEFRGVPWESRILDLFAVALDVEFEGVECPVVCPEPGADCDLQEVVVSWIGTGEDGPIIYNTENNCAYFFAPVPEFANNTIRICSVAYNSQSMVVSNNPNNCDIVLTAELIEAEANIQNGSYVPCILCEATGIRTTLTYGADPEGPDYANGNHTGAITSCQAIAVPYGPNVGVWFRLWWDCETCDFFTVEPGAPGQLVGDLTLTINYKEC